MLKLLLATGLRENLANVYVLMAAGAGQSDLWVKKKIYKFKARTLLCPLYALLHSVPVRVCGERLVEEKAYLWQIPVWLFVLGTGVIWLLSQQILWIMQAASCP